MQPLPHTCTQATVIIHTCSFNRHSDSCTPTSEITILLFTTVLSHWDFSHEKFGLLSPGKASCDRVALPNLRCMLGVLSVSVNHPTRTWTTGFLNVRTDVNACDCKQGGGGVQTHVRVSTLKVDSGRKIPCRNVESNLRQRRDGPMLCR